MSVLQFPSLQSSSPQPRKPNLTIKQLAKIMERPLYDQAADLQDFRWPDKAPRLPFYGIARPIIRGLAAGAVDIGELEEQVAELRRQIEESDDATPQRITRLQHNLRVLDELGSFARLREVEAILSVKTQRRNVHGVEVRSTYDLRPVIGGVGKFVFYHLQEGALDEDVARRTLELAHWMESDGAARMRDFEYWDLPRSRVLKWRQMRTRTVPRAEKHLIVVERLWETIQPPRRLRSQIEESASATGI